MKFVSQLRNAPISTLTKKQNKVEDQISAEEVLVEIGTDKAPQATLRLSTCPTVETGDLENRAYSHALWCVIPHKSKQVVVQAP
ncbi:hypothetical protein SeMB42_g01906 [Synchytrium endobioticum]|uniref:Uncharacterized protein n=1 Tax=Synchytrium endobioticum TaxID=286115 RepID=A0A507DIW1_9FUNG|nr:hypothetical protein SeMB42_g01906 [Synchytrium endobioticum]